MSSACPQDESNRIEYLRDFFTQKYFLPQKNLLLQKIIDFMNNWYDL